MTVERGFCLWFTGLSGAGKSTSANVVVEDLRARCHRVELLDGDEVREHISKGLTFSKEDRDLNILRIRSRTDTNHAEKLPQDQERQGPHHHESRSCQARITPAHSRALTLHPSGFGPASSHTRR